MDSFVRKKLEEWNLSYLKDIFEENMVDEEAFGLLDEESIKEMIIAVGPRRKFLKRLEEEKASDVNASGTPPILYQTIGTTNSSDAPPVSCQTTATTSKRLNPDFVSNTVKNVVAPSQDIWTMSKRFKPDFSIKSILESSIVGQEILNELNNKKLPRKNRIKMVQILVADIIEKFGDRPKADIKICMAKAVVEEFSFLKDEEGQGFEAWYTPGKGHHSATGWIEERLRNVRRRTNEGKPKTITDNDTASTSKSNLAQITALPECVISDEEYEGMIAWLKHHTEPRIKVSEYIKKTSIKRAAQIRENANLTVGDILKEHPRLFDTPGMIELDFRAVYSDVEDNLFLKWTSSFSEKVIEYASDQTKWQNYLNIPVHMMDIVDSDEAKQNISICLLPCILPTGRQGKRKCSIDDAIKAFVNVQPIGTNVPKYLDDCSSDEPHMLVLGDLVNAHQVFVIADGKGLERPNIITAVDTCFKLFYVMDIKYPWQCAVAWEFVQKVIYCLESKTRQKTSPAVISMRAALKS